MVLKALLSPDDYFAERDSQLARAVAVVLVVAIVTTTVVGAFGWVVSQRVTATTEVDNSERPPDWMCDGETESEAEGMVQENCDEPKTKTVEVGDLLWDAFNQQLPFVFVGVFFVWGLYAIGLHAVSAVLGGDGSFLDTLAVAGVGMAPSAIQALAGFGLLYVSLGGIDLSASNPELLAEQVRSLAQRAQGQTMLLSLLGAAWQGYVWTFGVKHARNLPTGAAAISGGVVALFVFLSGLA
ncbi:Yip1 family protein [Halorussus halophilus]|uniref:Yip1 family protein n=1 Tax=Halorussus halophilus TaxID=2650975 RepID=UPI001301072F|nr:Yip1 family protein [Halorussus halophilus]